MKREPIVIINSGITVVQAIIALIVAFGVELSQEQTAAILGVAMALGNLAAAFFGRRLVTPAADPRDADGNPLEPASPPPAA